MLHMMHQRRRSLWPGRQTGGSSGILAIIDSIDGKQIRHSRGVEVPVLDTLLVGPEVSVNK